MRVLVVSNMYPPHRGAPFGVFVEKQVEALKKLGVKVIAAVRTRDAKSAYCPFVLKTAWSLLLRSYDLVHAHYGFHSALLPALFKRKPLVITFHGGDALDDPQVCKVYRFLQRFVVARADRLIAVSREVAQVLVSDLGADPAKISVITCGVDSSVFYPCDKQACRRLAGISPDKKVAVFVGSDAKHKERKGIDVLCRAAASLPEVEFLIISDGMLDHYPSNFRLLGPQHNSLIPQWLCAADVFVLPSRSEGTPVVILEALSCGLPVIASRVGGIPEVIRDGENGFLVEPGNAEMLVDRLRCILGDPDGAREMGRRGRELIVSHYDNLKLVDRVIRVFGEALRYGGTTDAGQPFHIVESNTNRQGRPGPQSKH